MGIIISSISFNLAVSKPPNSLTQNKISNYLIYFEKCYVRLLKRLKTRFLCARLPALEGFLPIFDYSYLIKAAVSFKENKLLSGFLRIQQSL